MAKKKQQVEARIVQTGEAEVVIEGAEAPSSSNSYERPLVFKVRDECDLEDIVRDEAQHRQHITGFDPCRIYAALCL